MRGRGRRYLFAVRLIRTVARRPAADLQHKSHLVCEILAQLVALSTSCRSNSHGTQVALQQALRDRLHVQSMGKPAQKPAALHERSHSTRIQKEQTIFRLAKSESLGQEVDLHCVRRKWEAERW